MEAYRDGDFEAFAELFRRYRGPLLSLHLRFAHDLEDARELVQQTFLHVHRARHLFRAGAPLRPWLYTIARNLGRQHVRRVAVGRRSLALLALVANETVTSTSTGRSRAPSVRAAIARLPPGQREVIELHWFDGLPFAAIAERLGASPVAVRIRAHRGYCRLRRLLARRIAR
jgi:RNA polymerase sigma-70 factor (ECF subfamily)